MTLDDIGPDNRHHCAALEAEMALLVYPVVVSQKVASEGRRSLFSTRGRSTWRCVAKQDPEDIDAFQVKSTLLGDLRSRATCRTLLRTAMAARFMVRMGSPIRYRG